MKEHGGPMHLDVMAIIMVELCANFNYNLKESRYKIFKGYGPYCCYKKIKCNGYTWSQSTSKL